MSKRTASLLAWTMCALSLSLVALSLFLLHLNLLPPDLGVNTLVAVGFSVMGAVIVPHLSPNNPIGWLFCATGLLFGVTDFSVEYAIYALLVAPGSLPAGEAAAWIFSWVWVPAIGLSVFLPLVFPNGRLPSPRWRWVFWLSLLLILVGAISQMFAPGLVANLGGIYNPLGVEGLPNVWKLIQTLLYALLLVSVASLFVRRLRASRVERQQLKWFTYAATLAVIGLILTFTISELTGSVWLGWAGYVLLGLLAVLYFGGVTALQSLFSLLTGQGNTLAIVVSTLAIAALFNPLRRRIQSFIDRRFYRRKYDARKTLEAFGSKLRDETDLEKLCEDLAEVVDETVQPAHVSVILRSEVPSSSPTREQGQQDQQTPTHEG